MKAGKALVAALAGAGRDEAERVLAELGEAELRALAAEWPGWAHRGQEAPEGEWRVWVMLAGRGFGKTRAGAEWVAGFAAENPGAEIALVAATADEARRVMVEGPSGLIAAARRKAPVLWEASRKRLEFANGARAHLYSGANPEGLRGPQHHIAWCDELAKWRHPLATWTNLQLGLRCGERPRALVTTTPRTIAALKRILAEEGVMRTGGRTVDNPFISEAAVDALRRMHAGTRTGREELDGELLEDVEAPLWSREAIEKSRQSGTVPRVMRRVVVGVDPPAGTDGDACGIVVCGVDADCLGYVLADLSVAGLSPKGWARKVAAAAEAWGAQRVVAEANIGGKMVEAVLKGAGVRLPVALVHAREGKTARAEPVAALFESGRAKFAGAFPELEDELAGLSWRAGYQGPGRSPDRADAMVYALTELMLGERRAEPRIRQL